MDDKQQKLAEELLFAEKKAPSFAKRLFFGDFQGDGVIPFPQGDEDASLFLAKVQEFVKNHVDPVAIDREKKIPDKVVRGLAELGVFGMTVPRELGGLGMSQRAYCQLTEMLGRRCASTALIVNVHQSIGLKALLLFGTEAQKKKWLPPLAKGEILAAFSLTEPMAGSDASGVQTRAEYDPVKKVYKLNGQKQWTTNGSIAGVLTVMARTDDGKITAFLVTPDMPGFEVTERALDKVGFRGTHTANLAFHDVEVPEENVLGAVGKGLKVALTVLDFGRTTFGALCTGVAKECLERAVEHARTREQFGRPLASFGLVKEKLAKMSGLVAAMDATTYLTAGLIDAGVEDIMLESTMLKVFASDALWDIIYDTMQIFGGRSFFTDEPFERMMRDARLNMIGEGANEVMRAFIGAVGSRDVGMALKEGAIKHLFSLLFKPKIPLESKLARELEKEIRRFGRGVVRALIRYREGVLEQQLVLNRIATCAMALYTAAALLSKMESVSNEVGEYYCQRAFRTIENQLKTLFDPFDERTYEVSDHITRLETV